MCNRSYLIQNQTLAVPIVVDVALETKKFLNQREDNDNQIIEDRH